MDQWLLQDKEVAFWDAAVKGNTCLQVALTRLLRGEMARHLHLHQVSMLLDLTNFYDLVDHDLLAKEALSLGFPPLVLCLCIQVHKGPRIVQSGNCASRPILPQRGIIAGCPFGVVMAKQEDAKSA